MAYLQSISLMRWRRFWRARDRWGGGYVFVPTHNIQPDVTPDRLDRVYQVALKHRSYPVNGHE
jgi:hypothetical protein